MRRDAIRMQEVAAENIWRQIGSSMSLIRGNLFQENNKGWQLVVEHHNEHVGQMQCLVL